MEHQDFSGDLSNLPALSSRHLFDMHQAVESHQAVGDIDGGERRIAPIVRGTFKGERLSGTVLPAGTDWLLERADKSWFIDVRLALLTDDEQVIGMKYQGIRHGAPDILAKLKNREPVDPHSYYYRTLIQFEAGSPRYQWLNRIVAVAVGHRARTGPVYRVYEIT